MEVTSGFESSISFDQGSSGNNNNNNTKTTSASSSSSSNKSVNTSGIVKIFTKKTAVSYTSPWRCDSQTSGSGTGFAIFNTSCLSSSNKYLIVTNSHVVHRSTSILVRAAIGPPIKYVSKTNGKYKPALFTDMGSSITSPFYLETL